MTEATRNDMLADLAGEINELCEVRTHSEIIESEERDGHIRRRVRKRHTKTFPSLLDELLTAMSPSSGEDGAAAGFESRPAAELEPIQVMEMIQAQSHSWVSLLQLDPRPTLKGRLHGLVSANHNDVQLHTLLKDARYWVKRARQATGWDESPMTIGEPCPNCFRKNVLKVSPDFDYAICQRCGVDWPTEHIGLLSQVLEQNRIYAVLTEPPLRCASIHNERTCYRLETHIYEHVDSGGRWWYTTPAGDPYTEVSA